MEGCWSPFGKDIELDAVGRQFEPYLAAVCVCTAAPLWCHLGCCSRRVVVNNAEYKHPRRRQRVIMVRPKISQPPSDSDLVPAFAGRLPPHVIAAPLRMNSNSRMRECEQAYENTVLPGYITRVTAGDGKFIVRNARDFRREYPPEYPQFQCSSRAALLRSQTCHHGRMCRIWAALQTAKEERMGG